MTLPRAHPGSVDQSLQRLGVETPGYSTVAQADALFEPEEIAGGLRTLHQAGKVRYFGVSNFNSGQIQLLKKFVDQRLIVNQLQFSLVHTALIDSGMNVNIRVRSRQGLYRAYP